LAAEQIEIELFEFEQVFNIEAGGGGHCGGSREQGRSVACQ
jgi:hypothetical protein